MIEKIIDGISTAIHKEFGENYEIYTENIEQGLKEPCFSIVLIKPTNNLARPNRYYRTNQFCIHYFPSTSEKRLECQKVLERMYLSLEYIEIKESLDDKVTVSKCQGTNMNGEIDNDVLHFFVNYDMFVNKMEESTPMGSYGYNADVLKG